MPEPQNIEYKSYLHHDYQKIISRFLRKKQE